MTKTDKELKELADTIRSEVMELYWWEYMADWLEDNDLTEEEMDRLLDL